MIKWIVMATAGGLIGFILNSIGYGFDTWQYWGVLFSATIAAGCGVAVGNDL